MLFGVNMTPEGRTIWMSYEAWKVSHGRSR